MDELHVSTLKTGIYIHVNILFKMYFRKYYPMLVYYVMPTHTTGIDIR